MSDKQTDEVSMRMRIGDNELEVRGPRNFVEAKIKQFLEDQRQLQESRRTGSPAKAPTTSHPASSAKKLSVAQLFTRLKPKTDVDRTLVAGYFLESTGGAENFTAAETRDTIKKAKRTPPKNPSDAVAKNIRKGFMMSAGDKEGRMAFVLTSDGEEQVREWLEQ